MAPRHRDDMVMLQCAAAGDVPAQRAVVMRLFGRMRGICARILGWGADVDDAVQLAMIQVFQKADTYSGLGRLERWADRITVLIALDLARQRRRRSLQQDSEVDPDTTANPPSDQSLTESVPRSVVAYLDQLPEPQRQVLLLRHGMEYTVEEIAELIGVSVNTVKDRLLRARQAVRKHVRRDQKLDQMREGGR